MVNRPSFGMRKRDPRFRSSSRFILQGATAPPGGDRGELQAEGASLFLRRWHPAASGALPAQSNCILVSSCRLCSFCAQRKFPSSDCLYVKANGGVF